MFIIKKKTKTDGLQNLIAICQDLEPPDSKNSIWKVQCIQQMEEDTGTCGIDLGIDGLFSQQRE